MKLLRLPFLLFALPALAIAFMPGWPAALALDRTALAQGDWWRLWTGHWVHFSPSHLAWNLAVLLVAGAWLERVRPGWLPGFTLIASPLISVAVLAGEPHLASYGGLSGLATGVAALLALTEITRSRRDAVFWSVFLLLITVKSVLDTASVMPLFSRFAAQGVQASSVAHLAGLVVALLFCATAVLRRRKLRAQPRHDRHATDTPHTRWVAQQPVVEPSFLRFRCQHRRMAGTHFAVAGVADPAVPSVGLAKEGPASARPATISAYPDQNESLSGGLAD